MTITPAILANVQSNRSNRRYCRFCRVRVHNERNAKFISWLICLDCRSVILNPSLRYGGYGGDYRERIKLIERVKTAAKAGKDIRNI